MYAALVICHKNPNQIVRLVNKLRSSTCDVYVHIDSYVSNDDFNSVKQGVSSELGNGVFLVENRIHGELDKRSIVDITMILLSMAQNNDKGRGHYKYYMLFSGQDYPIKPMNWIEKQLDESYPKPFIDCTPYSSDNWLYYKFAQNRSVIEYNTWITKNLKKGMIRNIFRVSAIAFLKICELFQLTTKKQLEKLSIDIYGGSAWWILPDIAIDFILKEYIESKSYVKILLNSVQTPEETFFQILTMLSPIKDLVEINPPSMVSQNCKTWAYFSDEGKPFKGHPYIFTIEEIDKLRESRFWFARKFDTNVDERVLDAIDSFN